MTCACASTSLLDLLFIFQLLFPLLSLLFPPLLTFLLLPHFLLKRNVAIAFLLRFIELFRERREQYVCAFRAQWVVQIRPAGEQVEETRGGAEVNSFCNVCHDVTYRAAHVQSNLSLHKPTSHEGDSSGAFAPERAS